MTSRLHRSKDIRAVIAARRSARGRSLTVHARDRGDADPVRATVVAGRKVGGAVQRNRAKRRLRALLQADGPPTGTDLILVATPAAVDVPFASLTEEYTDLRTRAIARPGSAG